jgi:protein ImuB
LGVIPPGADREALASLPLAALRPSPQVAAAFRRWGIARCGRLAALPRGEVALRLGAEGARLWEIAAAQDDEPLVPTPLPDEPQEEVDLEFPLFEVAPLLFVLRGALDRLAVRLAVRGVVFGAVVLRLDTAGQGEPPLDTDSRLTTRGKGEPPLDTAEHRWGWKGGREVDERWLSLAAPMRDVPSILALLRVSLESRPPRAAVLGLVVRAVPAAGRPGQLSLFEPVGPAPQKLAVALARLAVLVGPGRVGTPVVPDVHRSAAPLPLRVLRPPLEVRWDPPAPPSAAGVRSEACLPSDVPSSGLRTTDHRFSGDLRRLSGPWKLRRGWWSEAPVERDYYDAELSSGALVRLYRDVLVDEWFVDGVYD